MNFEGTRIKQWRRGRSGGRCVLQRVQGRSLSYGGTPLVLLCACIDRLVRGEADEVQSWMSAMDGLALLPVKR
jgi:hypothetical protein